MDSGMGANEKNCTADTPLRFHVIVFLLIVERQVIITDARPGIVLAEYRDLGGGIR
jgi:hypothetical protein